MSDEQKTVSLQVERDDKPTFAVFSNFLQIARVATDVQFEFLFVDIQQVATALQKARASDEAPEKLSGVTVAKVVMPALSLMQVKDHLNSILDAIEKELGKLPDAREVHDGSSSVVPN